MEIMVNILLCRKGESIHGPETGGNYTYLQVKDWSKWEKKFVYGPYVHHVVGIYGDFRNALSDACRYLDIQYDTPIQPCLFNVHL